MKPFAPLPLATALLVALAAPALAQSEPTPVVLLPSQVTVMGEGEARAAPDLAMTSLTVLRTGETAQAALADANEASAAVAAAMRELGIEDADLQTGSFSVSPQYRYENREDGTALPPEIAGYEARNTLSVRVRDLDRLGEVLDRAIGEGVNQGGDIRFLIEDQSALENEAREEAFERARASAETLARAAGRSLGTATAISDEMAAAFPPPMPMASRMMAEQGAGGSVPVEIGENAVTARVRVVFELGDALP